MKKENEEKKLLPEFEEVLMKLKNTEDINHSENFKRNYNVLVKDFLSCAKKVSKYNIEILNEIIEVLGQLKKTYDKIVDGNIKDFRTWSIYEELKYFKKTVSRIIKENRRSNE